MNSVKHILCFYEGRIIIIIQSGTEIDSHLDKEMLRGSKLSFS